MIDEIRQKPSLDRPATYQIKVPGELDESWSDWAGGMTIAVESEGEGLPVTTLIGTIDQAALQSLLRRLYSLGSRLVVELSPRTPLAAVVLEVAEFRADFGQAAKVGTLSEVAVPHSV